MHFQFYFEINLGFIFLVICSNLNVMSQSEIFMQHFKIWTFCSNSEQSQCVKSRTGSLPSMRLCQPPTIAKIWENSSDSHNWTQFSQGMGPKL